MSTIPAHHDTMIASHECQRWKRMKVKTSPMQPELLSDRNKLSDYFALIKFRLLSLVLVSTSMGYYLAADQNGNLITFLGVLTGVACVGGGANALNQWYERYIDRLMKRTKKRPLPSKRLTENNALLFGIIISAIGFIIIGYKVNNLTLILSFASWASYLFLYTPLKSLTVLNTWVGAIPGALPAVMGCTAVAGILSWEALALFLILFFWQMPHFFAISWVYREDYMKGGFKMLSWNDPDGKTTSSQILIHTVLLLLVSIGLFFVTRSGFIYLISAIALGLFFLFYAIGFYRATTISRARGVFRASIIYLPVLFIAIILDKVLI